MLADNVNEGDMSVVSNDAMLCSSRPVAPVVAIFAGRMAAATEAEAAAVSAPTAPAAETDLAALFLNSPFTAMTFPFFHSSAARTILLHLLPRSRHGPKRWQPSRDTVDFPFKVCVKALNASYVGLQGVQLK